MGHTFRHGPGLDCGSYSICRLGIDFFAVVYRVLDLFEHLGREGRLHFVEIETDFLEIV